MNGWCVCVRVADTYSTCERTWLATATSFYPSAKQWTNAFYMIALDIVAVLVGLGLAWRWRAVVAAPFYKSDSARNFIVVGTRSLLLSFRESNVIADSKCKATSNRFCSATSYQMRTTNGENARKFKDETDNVLPMIAVETIIWHFVFDALYSVGWASSSSSSSQSTTMSREER